jgi:phosphoglycerol transferase MdoB-like AlkP superfamily enzyme
MILMMKSLAQLWTKLLHGRFGAVLVSATVFCLLAFLMRLALLLRSLELVSWNSTLLGSFVLGSIFDVGAAAFAFLPLVVLLSFLPRETFTKTWARLLVYVFAFVGCGALLFGFVAEWLFWDEFGARFNFIAVDYLVYTHEVVSNIRESYPMTWIFVSLGLGSSLCFALLFRTGWLQSWMDHSACGWRSRFKGGLAWGLCLLALGLVINEEYLPNFANNYNRELAKDGLWSLFAAFRANQLDYDQFYPTVPNEAAFVRVRSELLKHDNGKLAVGETNDLLRFIRAPKPQEPELKLNVIQITVESLSAEFLKRYGNQDGITPFLDSLIPQSLIFDRLYATGTRTDRGMEALTLSVPPTPGRSLVKRPKNDNLFTLGSVLRSRGYDTAFIYGGYGYFDNMNAFFGGNGYRVIDRASVAKSDISFANAWGACDEDAFRWTIREADRVSSQQGKPFHFFVMTTSNHRPFTYPDGKIDLPSKESGRNGAVKYTDYAIGELIREASRHSWFKNTVFVIVADHCASSAGKSELPVDRYHIPMIIYAPGGQLPKGVVSTLCSQVDFAPTLLALLNWSYSSRFYGWNVMAETNLDKPGRAFIANYQKLGFLTEERLSILKPVKESMSLHLDGSGITGPAASLVSRRDLEDAIAWYQTASWLFKNRRQTALDSVKAEPVPRPAVAGDGNEAKKVVNMANPQ